MRFTIARYLSTGRSKLWPLKVMSWGAMANPFHKVAYQLSLRSFPDMRCSKCVHAPTLRLAARDQSADANNLVQGMLGKARPESLPYIRIGGVAEVEHPGSRREVRNGFQVPRDD